MKLLNFSLTILIIVTFIGFGECFFGSLTKDISKKFARPKVVAATIKTTVTKKRIGVRKKAKVGADGVEEAGEVLDDTVSETDDVATDTDKELGEAVEGAVEVIAPVIEGAIDTVRDVAEAGRKKAAGLLSSISVNLDIGVMDSKKKFNACGCAGDKCQKYGKCKIPSYNAICCTDKCYCVQATVKKISEQLRLTCGMCDIIDALSPFKLLCREATIAEFNCWTRYSPDEPAPPPASIFQYAYF